MSLRLWQSSSPFRWKLIFISIKRPLDIMFVYKLIFSYFVNKRIEFIASSDVHWTGRVHSFSKILDWRVFLLGRPTEPWAILISTHLSELTKTHRRIWALKMKILKLRPKCDQTKYSMEWVNEQDLHVFPSILSDFWMDLGSFADFTSFSFDLDLLFCISNHCQNPFLPLFSNVLTLILYHISYMAPL